ncbi:hypothetical protein ACLOJK_037857 [Asimina triloba]
MMMMLVMELQVLRPGLLAENRELAQNQVELDSIVLNLALQLENDAVAAADGVAGSGVGLEDNGAHGLGPLDGIEILDDLADVADPEQFMGVQELALLVGREIRGEEAIGSAFPALVFTRSASLGAAAIDTTAADAHNKKGLALGVGERELLLWKIALDFSGFFSSGVLGIHACHVHACISEGAMRDGTRIKERRAKKTGEGRNGKNKARNEERS